MTAVALIAVSVTAAESCGFPDHQFIDDDLFYGKNGKSGAGGGSGNHPDASLTGGTTSAGGTTHAAGGSGGTEDTGGSGDRTGVGADGGIVVITSDGGRIIRGTGGSTMITGDAGPDSGSTPMEAGIVCNPGLDLCGDKCTDLQTSNTNCGECGKACTGANVCTAGKCAALCASGTPCTNQTVTTCVDTLTDENNCGGCNKACPGGTVCVGGSCLIDCGTLSRCGSQCFDTTKDDLHCGNCNTNCTVMGQVCSSGVCKTSCQAPTTACNNTCVDTSKDAQNCGGCGKPCGAKQACVASQCKTLVENCQNGSDDDLDGLTDCADPDCTAGYTCATLPAGWQGPFALWSGTPNTAPSCPAAYPSSLFVAHDKLNVPSYSCPDCGCTPSTGSTCNTLHFWYDTTATCSATAAWDISVDPNGVCVAENLSLYSKNFNPFSNSINSAQLTPPDQHNPSLPPYAQGSCSPNQITPSFPSPSWGLDAEGCGLSASATTGGGCSVGACMPKPATPFGAKLCIFKAGVTSCPSGYQAIPAGQQYYADWVDNRKCTSCTCGSVSCGGTVTAFTDTACTQNATPLDINGACTTLPKDPTPGGSGMNKQDTLSLRWDNGGPVCGQGTSNVVGAATPDSAITVCCQ